MQVAQKKYDLKLRPFAGEADSSLSNGNTSGPVCCQWLVLDHMVSTATQQQSHKGRGKGGKDSHISLSSTSCVLLTQAFTFKITAAVTISQRAYASVIYWLSVTTFAQQLLRLVFSSCFEIVSRADINVRISVHTRPQETPETL